MAENPAIILCPTSSLDLNNNDTTIQLNQGKIDKTTTNIINNGNNEEEEDTSKSPLENLDEIDKNIEEFCKIPGEPDIDQQQIQSLINDIDHHQCKIDSDQSPNLKDNINKNSESELKAPKTQTIRKKEVVTINIVEVVDPKQQNPSRTRCLLRKLSELFHTLKWSNIFYLSVLHIAFIFACIHAATQPVRFWTVSSAVIIGFLSGMGMSVGAHRYWAHRSFKAHTLFRLELMLLQTMTMNGSIFSYSRDHRNHHKYSDTEADPKNPARGLFHAHVGWWLWKKSPVVIAMGKKFDVSDLWNDKMVWFQHNFYTPLFLFFSVLLPTIVPWLLWNENLLTSFYVMVVIRITIVLHLLFCVNSLAHHYGYRPYDFRIRPADNRFINYLSMGEGNHNYHHVFPYDYRSNDKTVWEIFDPISGYIKAHEIVGLVHNCKRASPMVIEGIVRRKGIPAHFDKKRSLTFRVVSAGIDWIVGSIVSLWILYPFIIFKAATGRPVLIFDWT